MVALYSYFAFKIAFASLTAYSFVRTDNTTISNFDYNTKPHRGINYLAYCYQKIEEIMDSPQDWRNDYDAANDIENSTKKLFQYYKHWRKMFYCYYIVLASIIYDACWFIGLVIKELADPSLGIFKMIHNLFVTINTAFVNCFNNAEALTALGFVTLIVFFTVNIFIYLKLRKSIFDEKKQLETAFGKLYKKLLND